MHGAMSVTGTKYKTGDKEWFECTFVLMCGIECPIKYLM